MRVISATFNINFTGFDSSMYPGYTILWFYLATLVCPLLMVNILVAIMNETFKKSKKNLISKDFKALVGELLKLSLYWCGGRILGP